jgi:hypothetical protein
MASSRPSPKEKAEPFKSIYVIPDIEYWFRGIIKPKNT